MYFRSLLLLIATVIAVLMATMARPVWQPGVIENSLSGSRVLDDDLREWLKAEMRDRGIPGMSLAVVVDGQVAAVEALGVTDYWTRKPLRPDALMEVASNSKVITGLAAVRDLRAGRLNLDQPLSAYRSDFSLQGSYADQITLEMLLTHTAGLGNALGRPPSAERPPGERFMYSGEGFELVGELIASEAGTGLPEVLRSSVLGPLGVSDRATYAQVSDGDKLSSPHVSVTLPLLLYLLPGAIVFAVLALIVWLMHRFGVVDSWPDSIPLLTLATAVLVALALPFMLAPVGNALRFVLIDLVFTAAVVGSIILFRRWRVRDSMMALAISVLLAISVAASIFWRIPVPLQERTARFPASAGLRASAEDMGRLLAGLLKPPQGWEQEVSMLTTPRVRVNEENSWGLGIGIQQIGGSKIIWHWGVNYPGYQSLMLGSPDSGDGLVVLMNGGPMMITMEGPRFSGLELARELAGRVLPGHHGAYWHAVQ
jgi:CubicO group peptidase (beta-lactamase class C family)